MSNPHDIRIVEASVSLEPIPFRTPLKFGGRVVDRSQLINVAVTVERRDGGRATGHGSMPVGNVWAWPSQLTTADQSERVMIAFAEKATASAVGAGFGHPIEIVLGLIAGYVSLAEQVRRDQNLRESIPVLAQLVAASPLDAAIHDAYGRAHHANSYRTLSREYLAADLSQFLDDSFRGDRLDRFVLPAPKPRMPLYHLVGALDPLTDADIAKRIGDGLPETLPEWIAADGLTHLKIKLSGDDPAWDIERVLAVDAVASQAQAKRGCATWWYSCDFNEKCASPEVVVAFLRTIRERNPRAFDRIQYLEQPLPRNLRVMADQHVGEAAKLKPVVIDESLVSYGSFLAARDLGYTGIALKACKGQTESLLMAAAAQKHGMFLCVQDLTCPGRSFLHSASLAAWVPGVAAIEGNARQYCPAPNAPWSARYPGLFEITDGTVATGTLDGEGLGFS
jgi:L-alanine-DL-glutamate epimerase-like enolase superfamily enzyme